MSNTFKMLVKKKHFKNSFILYQERLIEISAFYFPLQGYRNMIIGNEKINIFSLCYSIPLPVTRIIMQK